MIKQLLALAAGALLSLNASAGYVQYDFAGPISGSFIQHDTDGSIAYFNLNVHIEGVTWSTFMMNLSPQVSEGSTELTGATTMFRNNGPTNFSIFSDYGADQRTGFDISFTRSTGGNFSYTANYDSSIYFCGADGCGFEDFSGTHRGVATRGVVDPLFAISALDQYGGYYDGIVSRIVPTYIGRVPEPVSLALFGLGAAGLVAARRRKPLSA